MNAILALVPTVSDNAAFVQKTTLTENEGETLTKSFIALHGVLKTMGKNNPIADDFLTNTDTLGELLACAHRVIKDEKVRKVNAERDAFCGKIDSLIKAATDKRGKAIAAYNALDADLKSELPAPVPNISLWVEDFLPLFGKGYDLARVTKTLHDMGYMVHVPKVDGRMKEPKVTPPYLTATVGQPFRKSSK